MMRGPFGWVLNLGGRYGTPGIADDSNIVKVTKEAKKTLSPPGGGLARQAFEIGRERGERGDSYNEALDHFLRYRWAHGKPLLIRFDRGWEKGNADYLEKMELDRRAEEPDDFEYGPNEKPCLKKRCRRRYSKNGRRIPRAVPEVKTCRTKPPAKYRRLGAKTKNDYAFPECWMYPIHMSSERETKKHIRLAATRLSQHGHRYPKWVREKIARRLDAAKRRYGIGPYRVRTKRTLKATRKAA